MKQLHLLYGNDSYRLRKRLDALWSQADELNSTVIDADERWSLGEFEAQLMAMPFLAERRWIWVKNPFRGIPASDVERVLLLLAKIPETTFLVLSEVGKPDARTRFFKELTKLAKGEVFEPLSGAPWRELVRQMLQKEDLALDASAAAMLATELEGDAWQLEQVARQLKLWVGDRVATAADVALFVAPRPGGDSFKLLRGLSEKRGADVVRQLYDLWRVDEAPLRVLGAIVYQYRQILTAKAHLADGLNTAQAAAKLRAPSFVSRGLVTTAEKFSWPAMRGLYYHLEQIDESSKNGTLEPKAALELLVYNLMKFHRQPSKAQPTVMLG